MRIRLGSLCFLLLSILLFSCGKAAAEEEEGGLRITALNETETALVYRTYSTELKAGTELIDELLTELRKDGEDGSSKAVLRAGADVSDHTMEGDQLILTMEPGYRELPPNTEILIRAALVRTLTQAEDVATVRMMLGSEALTDAAGNAVAVMSADSFVDDGGEGNVVELQLYFANQKGDRLVGSRRNVVCDSNTSMERLVVEQLIEGPGTPEARASIPAQTRILSVSLSDGICYVDLDSAFLEGDGSLTPQVSIYSIVNSLSELGNVHRVRIMINGKSNIMYREVMDLEESYIRNLDMIE